MNRRDFLRRVALVAAGVVAADQLDLLERLSWQPQQQWTGWSATDWRNGQGGVLTEAKVKEAIRRIWNHHGSPADFPRAPHMLAWNFDKQTPPGTIYLLPPEHHAA